MKTVREQKQELRNRLLELRAGISEKNWKKRSGQIIEHLLQSDFFKEAVTIHTYISMNERREVCTDSLLKTLIESDKKAVVPKTNFSDTTLTHSQLGSISELESNKWGVREPSKIRPVDIGDIDLIIVPMAAADRKGKRLGYGKGFYDRFLAQSEATKVGLVFSEFLFDEIPAENFDEKLDIIITEEGVIFT